MYAPSMHDGKHLAIPKILFSFGNVLASSSVQLHAAASCVQQVVTFACLLVQSVSPGILRPLAMYWEIQLQHIEHYFMELVDPI